VRGYVRGYVPKSRIHESSDVASARYMRVRYPMTRSLKKRIRRLMSVQKVVHIAGGLRNPVMKHVILLAEAEGY
jgi:hypothetical protein